MLKLTVFDPRKRRNVLVGFYNETTKTFSKKVTNKHYMILEQGYGIQESIINLLKQKGCETIVIETPKSRIVSQLKDWLEIGRVKNYGHGLQRFLSIKNLKGK